jgi:hypothetical protein
MGCPLFQLFLCLFLYLYRTSSSWFKAIIVAYSSFHHGHLFLGLAHSFSLVPLLTVFL